MLQTSYNIADNLPESINRTNINQLAQLIDKKIHETENLLNLINIYPNIDNLPSELIDQLAIQLHVDFYNTTLDLASRRALVKNSIRWHMKKGTKAAVVEVLEAAFNVSTLQEWFEYDGKPYHFRVVVNGTYDDRMTKKAVKKAIETVKNVRSWLDDIEISYNFLQEFSIVHAADIMGFNNANHNFWNLGNGEAVYWDGKYTWDRSVHWDGKSPDANYRERQPHSAEIWRLVAVMQTRPYFTGEGNAWQDSEKTWEQTFFAWGDATRPETMALHTATTQMIDADGKAKGDITDE